MTSIATRREIETELAPGSRTVAQAIAVRGLVVLSGQLGLDHAGKLSDPTCRGQAVFCFDRIRSLLEKAGLGLKDIVKLTCFLTSAADYPAYAEVKAGLFPADPPTGTAVIVAGLLVPGALLEVEAIAIDPNGII